jgi:hypothetical protein
LKTLFHEGRKDQFFDADLAIELYNSYLVTLDEDTMEELILQIGTLVDVVCSLDIGPSVGQCNHSTLKSDAIQLVYFKLIEGKISTRNSRAFMNYLWVLIRNSMIKSIRELNPQRFDSWVSNNDPTAGAVDSHLGAEARMYAHQLRAHAFNVFKADIRFSGNERKACIFIAECLLGLRKLDTKAARFRFKITEGRTTFLTNYVKYLIKNSADAVRQIDERIVANES